MVEKQTISPHEVIRAAYATHPSFYAHSNPEEGKKQHASIQSKIKTYTQGLAKELNTDLTTTPESFQEQQIAQNLYLRAYLDLLISTPNKKSQLVIEIKPTPKKTHFAQLALNCLALSPQNPEKLYAFLYCYKEKSIYQLQALPKLPENQLKASTKLAHALITNQDKINSLKNTPTSTNTGLQKTFELPGLNYPSKKSAQNQIAHLSNSNIKTRRTFEPLFFQLANHLTKNSKKLSSSLLKDHIKSILS